MVRRCDPLDPKRSPSPNWTSLTWPVQALLCEGSCWLAHRVVVEIQSAETQVGWVQSCCLWLVEGFDWDRWLERQSSIAIVRCPRMERPRAKDKLGVRATVLSTMAQVAFRVARLGTKVAAGWRTDCAAGERRRGTWAGAIDGHRLVTWIVDPVAVRRADP